jgi:serine protease Do
MGKSPRLRLGLVLLILALLLAGGLTVTLWGPHAADSTLWTEGKQAVPTSNLPWPAVAKADTPAVVNISTTQVVQNPMAQGGPGGPFQDFFRQFLGEVPQTLRRHALGSGFLIRADGFLVTNNHVVEGASDINVKLADGREFPATVVGRDEQTDLALLKIAAAGLPILSLGDSDALEVGQPVMAIGNPFGLEGTVTTGIVSAKGRVIGEGPYDEFIQTDASINPGNSGGPLVNAAGDVVGINTAIASQSGGSVGIGFAIPINEAKGILRQLAATGHVTRGWLGVAIQPVTEALAKALQLPAVKGALVAEVLADSPAATAGVQPGDVIVEYDGHPVSRESDLPRLVAATPIGKVVAVQVIREGKAVPLTATIAAQPQREQVASPRQERQRLGLRVQPLTPQLARELGVKDRAGVVVAGVEDGSPAADAGLQPGDVIVQVNRQPVQTVAEFRQAVETGKAGEPILLLVHRQDASLFMTIEPGSKPQG